MGGGELVLELADKRTMEPLTSAYPFPFPAQPLVIRFQPSRRCIPLPSSRARVFRPPSRSRPSSDSALPQEEIPGRDPARRPPPGFLVALNCRYLSNIEINKLLKFSLTSTRARRFLGEGDKYVRRVY